MFDFSNQTVIVTGGTRGIGKGIVGNFLKAGANVVATFKNNEQAAENLKEEFSNSMAGRLVTIQCDVTVPEQVDHLFSRIEESFESIEVLVNNSGIRKDSLLLTMKESDWDDVLDTNLKGSFLMCQKAVRLFLKKPYGRIVNISSLSGLTGIPGQANYAASKAGLSALTQSLSKEVASRNITVNSLAPGFVKTDLIADLSEKKLNAYLQQIPIKRLGTVEEISHGVLFLASREASYITGTTLEVTGGLR